MSQYSSSKSPGFLGRAWQRWENFKAMSPAKRMTATTVGVALLCLPEWMLIPGIGVVADAAEVGSLSFGSIVLFTARTVLSPEFRRAARDLAQQKHSPRPRTPETGHDTDRTATRSPGRDTGRTATRSTARGAAPVNMLGPSAELTTMARTLRDRAAQMSSPLVSMPTGSEPNASHQVVPFPAETLFLSKDGRYQPAPAIPHANLSGHPHLGNSQGSLYLHEGGFALVPSKHGGAVIPLPPGTYLDGGYDEKFGMAQPRAPFNPRAYNFTIHPEFVDDVPPLVPRNLAITAEPHGQRGPLTWSSLGG